jgi:hypothetical protein
MSIEAIILTVLTIVMVTLLLFALLTANDLLDIWGPVVMILSFVTLIAIAMWDTR